MDIYEPALFGSPECLGCKQPRAELKAAKAEADTLCIAIHQRHYKTTAPEFDLCDSVPGVISQIDNMVAGLFSELDRYKKVVDEACGLLKIASCPNRNCTGGVLQVGINGDDIEQCQWCYFRDELLRELEANNVSRQP